MNLQHCRNLLLTNDLNEIDRIYEEICDRISILNGLQNEDIARLRRDPFAELLLNPAVTARLQIENKDTVIAAW